MHPVEVAITAVHRLDRLTSGVLVLARTKDAARQLQGQMMEGRTTKEYVCRVIGEFPRSSHARESRWHANRADRGGAHACTALSGPPVASRLW